MKINRINKNLVGLAVLFVCLNGGEAYAQSSSTPIIVETVTSLLPKDGNPLKFSNIDALNAFVPARISELKQLIVEVQNDAEKANYYREELWRVENAVVEIK